MPYYRISAEDENQFTKAFFAEFLDNVTPETRNAVVSKLSYLKGISVKEVDTQFALEQGTIPDVRIKLDDSRSIFVEVKIRTASYKLGQVKSHIEGIAHEYPKSSYVFVDKTWLDFAELEKELNEARQKFPEVEVHHSNWYEMYQFLENLASEFDSNHKDHFLITEMLEEMGKEKLRMKPFMGFDMEQVGYLKEFRSGELRDLAGEINDEADKVLDEIEYLLYLKYPGIKVKIDKSELIIEEMSPKIEDQFKPKVYSAWLKDEKKFEVFIALYKEKQDEGYIFPFNLFHPVSLKFKGNDLVIDHGDGEVHIDDWIEGKKEIPDNCTEMWIGRYLNPEEYKGREIVDEIFKGLSLMIDKLTPFLLEESKRKKRGK